MDIDALTRDGLERIASAGDSAVLEEVRVAVSADGAATLSFRDHVVAFAELPTMPPWFRDTA